MENENESLNDGMIIGYEPIHEPSPSSFIERPNGVAALVWAMLAVSLAPLFCFSLPLAAVSIWCAVWTLRQPADAKRLHRNAAILAIIVLVLAAFGLGVGIVSLM